MKKIKRLNKLKNDTLMFTNYAVVDLDEYNDMWNKIADLVHAKKSENTLDYMDRIVSTGNTTAYLKIAEGCSNKCTYCAIHKYGLHSLSRY